MTKIDKVGGCWPTAQQELLLRASFLQGDKAISAWNSWQSAADIDRLDLGSHYLMPLLYRNLRANGVDHSLMKKLKGLYRYTWSQNQILYYQIAELLQSFHQAGINKTVLLNEAALVLLYYKDYGLRNIGHFNVLIPIEMASNAIRLLKEWHWIPTVSPTKLTEKYISKIIKYDCGLAFKKDTNHSLFLHWRVLPEGCHTKADNDSWADIIKSNFYQLPVYALNPSEQLLHNCVPSIRRNCSPQWVADAMMILKTSPEIDWERLVSQAQQRCLILSLRNRLNYLHDKMDAPIPSTVLQSLQALPVSKREYLRSILSKTRLTRLFANRI